MKNPTLPQHRPQSSSPYPEIFLALISSRLNDLPAAQRKIGEALITRLELLGCFFIVELSQKTGTSQATIIRFCQSLGFDGFLQFTKEVQQAFQAQLTVTDRFALTGGTGLI